MPPDYLNKLRAAMFRTVGQYGWDIRISIDMQEGSPMRDIIDLLHAYLSGQDSSATFCEESNNYGYGTRSRPLLQWFCRQLHVRLSSNAD